MLGASAGEGIRLAAGGPHRSGRLTILPAAVIGGDSMISMMGDPSSDQLLHPSPQHSAHPITL
jgi:hypothetical protein